MHNPYYDNILETIGDHSTFISQLETGHCINEGQIKNTPICEKCN